MTRVSGYHTAALLNTSILMFKTELLVAMKAIHLSKLTFINIYGKTMVGQR